MIISIKVTVQYRTVHLLHSPYESAEQPKASPIAAGDFHGLAAYLSMFLNRYVQLKIYGLTSLPQADA